MNGFLRALELGVTTLEMDAVISRDREVVLSHDPWFSSDFSALPSGERVRPHAKYGLRLYEMDYETVCTYDCGLENQRFPRQKAGSAAKPLLREVIRTAESFVREHGIPPVFYNVETKSSPAGDDVLHPRPEVFVELLIEVVASEGVLDRTIVQSFDPRTLRVLRRGGTPVQISWLIERGDYLGLQADLEILGFTPNIYSPDFRLLHESLVQDAHVRGMRVIPWTVNNPEDIRRMIEIGADGLITDYPDTAQMTLGALPPSPAA